MEIKTGIVINGVLHKLVSIHSDEPCSNCSLREKCESREKSLLMYNNCWTIQL